jgi:hypothetical protein
MLTTMALVVIQDRHLSLFKEGLNVAYGNCMCKMSAWFWSSCACIWKGF